MTPPHQCEFASAVSEAKRCKNQATVQQCGAWFCNEHAGGRAKLLEAPEDVRMLKVLIACEFSGTVREAFSALGHNAWSCDLLPTRKPGNHIQGDVSKILSDGWDLMIAHPPCTFLTIAAEWAFGDGPYHQKVKPGTLVGAARRAARDEAVEFVRMLLDAPIPRIAVENPIGALSRLIRKPDQVIQPHQFGADASKATCLWLKNLPPLTPTGHVAPRMVNNRPRWGNQTDSGQNRLSPSEDRWAERSVTYPGIADAMAGQWGKLKPEDRV